jgi:hypothetical protein
MEEEALGNPWNWFIGKASECCEFVQATFACAWKKIFRGEEEEGLRWVRGPAKQFCLLLLEMGTKEGFNVS